MASATSSRSDPDAVPRGAPDLAGRPGRVLTGMTAGTWAATWLLIAQRPVAGVLTGLALLGSALLVGLLFRLRPWCESTVTVLAVAAGVLTAGGVSAVVTAAHVAHRQSPTIDALVEERATVRALVRLTSDPRPVRSASWGPAVERFAIDARLIEVSWRGSEVAGSAPLLLVTDARWSTTRLDGVYTTTGVLGPSRDRAGPYVATLTAQAPAALDPPRWSWRAAEHMRSRLREAVEPLPGPAPGLLPSLAVGDTSGLPTDLRDDMRTAGLSHLTVVSGANVTLICGAAVALVAWAGAGPRRQVLAGALALVALVIVARPDPSVLRAAVMGGIGLVGLLLGRPGRAAAALAAACCLLLLVDPWLSRSYGLALSAAATGGIVVLARPLARRMPAWLPPVVGYPLAVTVAAQVSVTPILVMLDPSLATYAVPANLLAGPVVAPTMVVTTVAAVIATVSPVVGGWVAWPAAAGAAWLAWLSHTVAALPAASLPWWSGAVGVLAAAVLGGVMLVVVVSGEWLRPMWRPARRVVVLLLPGVMAAGAISAARGLPVPWETARPPHDWSVVVCDVGQGEAVLIRAGPTAAIVIDTGPDPAAMTRCLTTAGVVTVPLLILTHFHADHVAGVGAVLGTARVAQVWHGPQPAPVANAATVAAALASAGVPSRVAATGDSFVSGDVSVEVLWPDRVLDPAGAVAGDGTAINDTSLVVRSEQSGLSLLCLGDIELAAQERLLRLAPTGSLDADVSTISHHGSGVQLPALYGAISPRLAVASVGADNGYGHPDPTTMSMIAATGSTVMSTADSGSVSVVAGTGGIRVRSTR